MIISHSRKFVFIHIHKTAGELVSEALLPFLGRGDLLLGTTLRGEIANAWYDRRHGLQKHSGARKVRAYLGDAWDDYLKFSFVRDPFDRLRSLYFYFERMVERRRRPSLRNALLWLPGTDFRDPLKWPGMRGLSRDRRLLGLPPPPGLQPGDHRGAAAGRSPHQQGRQPGDGRRRQVRDPGRGFRRDRRAPRPRRRRSRLAQRLAQPRGRPRPGRGRRPRPRRRALRPRLRPLRLSAPGRPATGEAPAAARG